MDGSLFLGDHSLPQRERPASYNDFVFKEIFEFKEKKGKVIP